MTTLKLLAACRVGATAVEYSLIAGLIALAIIAAVRTTGQQLQVPFQEVVAGFEQGQ